MKKIISSILLTASLTFAQAETQEKPNFLFIIADDQCWETVGCIGGEVITPSLDRLVDNGVSFRRAYNMGSWTGAICMASRHMFNTGYKVWDCKNLKRGKPKNDSKKPAKKPSTKGIDLPLSWSQHLSKAGYKTYFSGKWHVNSYQPAEVFDVVGTIRGGMPRQTPEGYNRPKDENDKTWLPWDKSKGGFWQGGTHWSEVLRDEAVDFIDTAAKEDDPFFMYIAFNAPHDPRQAPKEFFDMYPIDSIKLPNNFMEAYPYQDKLGRGKDGRDESLVPFPRTEYSVKVNRAEYYALITHMDVQIGKILDALEASGKLDNTYIFYTADHGLAVGHHGFIGKQNLYEHSMGAPLIINGPGLEKGKRITENVYIQDIMPSTLELAGVEVPEKVFFKSLMPLATGETDKGRDHIYGGFLMDQRSILQGDWKLISYPTIPKFRLYNIKNDPDEMNDLAENPEHAGKLQSLKILLVEEMERQNDPLLETYPR
ncbi:sulfatase-like hydrolase/transferase [Persicirhabdus sediminis]|uniref:Sulfatase-like hydrolase/transferase n=1 Tax=Persicirhabdus sediminis TaxID=454144 RepID=A0A8J7ME85_9BACT|nr:sulfatase-like hydrolase/transferase [Persicirhabdus sediminis]MBK1791397.1 sulfatase-like hydrolase/transferase [Persicirhabdus sediminis]